MKTSPWEAEIIQPISCGGNSTGKAKDHQDTILPIRSILKPNPIPHLQGERLQGPKLPSKRRPPHTEQRIPMHQKLVYRHYRHGIHTGFN